MAAVVTLFEQGLRAAFSVGPISVGSLAFTGLEISIYAASATLSARFCVQNQAYVDGLDVISAPAPRLATKGATVTADEGTLHLRDTGALLLVAGETLPHLECGSAVLARHIRQAFLSDRIRANKVLKAARGARALGLRFRPMPVERWLCLFSDSSAVTLNSSVAEMGVSDFVGAAGGILGPAGSIPAVSDGVTEDLVAWGSHRQGRLTHSSFLIRGVQPRARAALCP